MIKKYIKILNSDVFLEIFYKTFKNISWWLLLIWFLLFISHIFLCLVLSPLDYQHKNMLKLIYIHVPNAFMSIFIYGIMGVYSFLYLFYNIKIFHIFAQESVKIGILCTFLTLVTGSVWAKPMWGTWWIWDARLTSELILLFLYISYWCLKNAINDNMISGKYCAILNLIGLINLPIIHFSVNWWYTLHQGYTIKLFFSNNLNPIILYLLVYSLCVYILFYISIIIYASCTNILNFESNKNWIYKEFSIKKINT